MSQPHKNVQLILLGGLLASALIAVGIMGQRFVVRKNGFASNGLVQPKR